MYTTSYHHHIAKYMHKMLNDYSKSLKVKTYLKSYYKIHYLQSCQKQDHLIMLLQHK